MAKLTKAGLVAFATAYVTAAKQAGSFSVTTDNIIGAVDKIGKMVTLDGTVTDKLAFMDGDDLPFGKTIEEWFLDFVPAKDVDTTGADENSPAYISSESPAYSMTLGHKVIKWSVPYNDIERACIGPTEAGEMTAKITLRGEQSYTLHKFAEKKQLVANLIAKASAATNKAALVENMAVPNNNPTSKAFIKAIKTYAEDASFVNDHNLAGALAAEAAEELVLLVKKGVMPSVEVEALSAAFNAEKLAIPARVIVLDDFGDNTDAWAVLLDPRGVKLHKGYENLLNKLIASVPCVNFWRHFEDTGFISKFTYVHVFKNAA